VVVNDTAEVSFNLLQQLKACFSLFQAVALYLFNLLPSLHCTNKQTVSISIGIRPNRHSKHTKRCSQHSLTPKLRQHHITLF
jgi:hypothetical protein